MGLNISFRVSIRPGSSMAMGPPAKEREGLKGDHGDGQVIRWLICDLYTHNGTCYPMDWFPPG